MNATRIIPSLLAVLLTVGSGCDGGKPTSAPTTRVGTDPHPGPVRTVDVTVPLEPDGTTKPAAVPRVVFLGDSLTAGLGLEADQAFPAVVARQ